MFLLKVICLDIFLLPTITWKKSFYQHLLLMLQRGKNLTHNGDANETKGEPPKKVARQSNDKNYVPNVRSGNWAVLLTLLSEEEKPNFKGESHILALISVDY